jgi:hypothetical protein
MALPALLLGSIVVATAELLKATGDQAEAVFEALVLNAAVVAADAALLDPSRAGQPDVSPPSITYGAFATPSTGSSLAALNHDLGTVADHMLAQGVPLAAPVVIMSPASALRVGGLASLPGAPTLTVPVVKSVGAGDQVVLLDAGLLAYTDGGVIVDLSQEASLELDDAPTGDIGAPTGATTLTSLWQVDAVAFRISQFLNWALAHSGAVGVVTGFGATP